MTTTPTPLLDALRDRLADSPRQWRVEVVRGGQHARHGLNPGGIRVFLAWSRDGNKWTRARALSRAELVEAGYDPGYSYGDGGCYHALDPRRAPRIPWMGSGMSIQEAAEAAARAVANHLGVERAG